MIRMDNDGKMWTLPTKDVQVYDPAAAEQVEGSDESDTPPPSSPSPTL
jgi:hypothetical protein